VIRLSDIGNAEMYLAIVTILGKWDWPTAAKKVRFERRSLNAEAETNRVWTISPITEQHDRGQFDCGEPSLDQYLKQSARQNGTKGISRTFVLVREGEPRVLGYYTLAGGQFERDNLPAKATKPLPRYPVPVVVLGRLAVDRSAQGEKLGRALLKDALHRVLEVSDAVGFFAVYVRAINERGAEFYVKFGFVPFPSDPLQLFLPLSHLRAATNTAPSE
jgi:GNAT superfamily N-acetyltransferase